MSFDTFSAALPHLRPHTKLSTPVVYAHLAHLLNQYSTGLSLPITLDSLSELSKTHARKLQPLIEATVVSTHHNPEIHLLNFLNSHIAFFPPSQCPPLPPSTTILLPPLQDSDDALSLAQTCLPDHHIRCAILPTQNIAIRLPFPHNLPHPLKAYSLCSIWQNRDLTPPAVYATLVEANREHSSLRLIDHTPNSPSVLLKLSHTRHQLPRILPVPCTLLVTAPIVNPNENSFTLHDSTSSTVFFQPQPNINENNKRKRPSSVDDTVHSAGDLEPLQRSEECRDPITLQTRVQTVDKGAECIVTTCENVCITVPHAHYEQGDELLLKGVTFSGRWVAQHVLNISTMQGVLHCPFIRKIVSIKQAMVLCREKYSTAQIRVIIERAVKQGDLIRLFVTDLDRREKGGVFIKARGFQTLFAVSRAYFTELSPDLMAEKVSRIRDRAWLMTVTCGVADVPVLTACIRGG